MILGFRCIDADRDRELAVRFRRDSYVVSFGTDASFGGEASYVASLRSKLARADADAVFALDPQGTPIGQLEVQIKTIDERRSGYVNVYYLLPEWRGQGLGVQLHEYAQRFLRGQGVEEYELHVAEGNAPARRFYEKLGLEAIEREGTGAEVVLRLRGTVTGGAPGATSAVL